jgi:hypothetical protein
MWATCEPSVTPRPLVSSSPPPISSLCCVSRTPAFLSLRLLSRFHPPLPPPPFCRAPASSCVGADEAGAELMRLVRQRQRRQGVWRLQLLVQQPGGGAGLPHLHPLHHYYNRQTRNEKKCRGISVTDPVLIVKYHRWDWLATPSPCGICSKGQALVCTMADSGGRWTSRRCCCSKQNVAR